jgi:hypothetical protein
MGIYTCYSCGKEYKYLKCCGKDKCDEWYCKDCYNVNKEENDKDDKRVNKYINRRSKENPKKNNDDSNKHHNNKYHDKQETKKRSNGKRSNSSSPQNEDEIIKDLIKNVFGADKIHFINIDNLKPSPKRPKRTEDDSPGKLETDIEKELRPDVSEFPFEWIGNDINNIDDLIKLGKKYDIHKKIKTNIDLWKCSKLVEPLEELQQMIGLKDIKESIFQQVIFHLQNLDDINKDMNHTVIKGPPGVGKTQISHIIAKIYKGLGFLKKDKVISVKRDDLIAGYLGQTAIKTKKKLEEALGGVLLIDEAYSLGDGGNKDSFSKEAVDLLTSYLSEHGHEFICIIAGYKEALEKRFFSINEGLARRFTIHYDIKPYSGEDLRKIFFKVINDGGWTFIEDEISEEFFKGNEDKFPNFGGDMLSLFSYCKKSHSKRLLKVKTYNELQKSKKVITNTDLDIGFKLYCSGNGYKLEMNESEKQFLMSMYT